MDVNSTACRGRIAQSRYEIVWDVVENKIPALREDILEILKQEGAI
jgi:uncharacterized protein with HEPN domain